MTLTSAQWVQAICLWKMQLLQVTSSITVDKTRESLCALLSPFLQVDFEFCKKTTAEA